jgi:predicted phosphoribosyltransferase
MDKFKDRIEAGCALAQSLAPYAQNQCVIILALPRGGVPVGYEIAKMLSLPLDVFIVRKLGLPGHEELAMGAIASGGTVVLNESLLSQLTIPPLSVKTKIEEEQEELVRREHLYRGARPFPELQGKIVILVDDGIATGATMKAAIKALNTHKPASIVVAVPVAAYSTCKEIEAMVDKLICPLQPVHFNAVGLWYEHFLQTTDGEVLELLRKANYTIQ